MKILNKILSQIRFYTIIEPECYVGNLNYKNLLRNIFYFIFIDFNLRKFFKSSLKIMIKMFLDTLSLIFIPLIIIIFFSKYRFIQLDYSQIGIFSHQLNGMTKFHFLNKKIPIICVPKSISRSHIKNIFENLIIIDSIFLNILFLPLINSKLISCPPQHTESYFKNALLERTSPFFFCKIIKKYSKENKNNNFLISNNYLNQMQILFEKKFRDFDIQKTFILHVRDENYIASSYLRAATLKNYISSIEMINKNNFNVIRIVHPKSEKLSLSKNYSELDISSIENQYFQYFLLKKCKGFICCHSGPGPLGAFLDAPILELNLFPLEFSYALKKNDIYVPKKIKTQNGKLLSYNEIFSSNLRFIASKPQMDSRNLIAIENSEDEIYESVKEFIKLQEDKSIPLTINQSKFKECIPENSSFRDIEGRLSDYYLKKNYNLFFL